VNPDGAMSKTLLDYKELAAKTLTEPSSIREMSATSSRIRPADSRMCGTSRLFSSGVSRYLTYSPTRVSGLPTKMSPSIPVIESDITGVHRKPRRRPGRLDQVPELDDPAGRIWHPMWVADCEDLDVIRTPGYRRAGFFRWA